MQDFGLIYCFNLFILLAWVEVFIIFFILHKKMVQNHLISCDTKFLVQINQKLKCLWKICYIMYICDISFHKFVKSINSKSKCAKMQIFIEKKNHENCMPTGINNLTVVRLIKWTFINCMIGLYIYIKS